MAKIRAVIFQSFVPESEYERKRRYRQVETIGRLATSLETLYARLEGEEVSPELNIEEESNGGGE
jgi:hypothetical protein